MGTFSRYPRYRLNWGGILPPAIKTLLIACSAVFLAQTLVALIFGTRAEFLVEHYLGVVPYAVTHGFVWQLFTYLFLHGGIWHLLFNLLFLWMFGKDLEATWGRRRFYFYFFLTGIGAGLTNVVVKTIVYPAGSPPQMIPTIGASGAIYGIILAAALVFPDQQVWLIPFPVSIPMKIYALAAAGIEFFFTLGAGGDNVSHVTHLGGMLVGYLYLRRGSFLYRVRNGLSDWKFRRARRKFEVYMKKHRDEPPARPGGWVN